MPAAGWCSRSMPVSARCPIDIVPVEIGAAPRRALGSLPPHGAVVWLTGLPASGKSTLARALERRLFSRGGSPDPARRRHLARRPQRRPRLFAQRPQREYSPPRRSCHPSGANGHIAIVAAVSPSRDDRAVARQIADTAVSRNPRRDTGRASAKAAIRRGITPRRAQAACRPSPASATTISRPLQRELVIDTSTASVGEAAAAIEHMLVSAAYCSRKSLISLPISRAGLKPLIPGPRWP